MKNYIPVAIMSLSILIGLSILANAYKYKFKTTETISVTGLAERDFSSDQIVWSGYYDRKNIDLKLAYAALKNDEKTLKEYLMSKGIKENEMVFSAVSIEKEYTNRFNNQGQVISSEFAGFNLQQTVTVDSKDIDKVEKVSREVTELIERGIEFRSSAPSYYYSKLSELKIDLLAKASADAKLRAETIAKNSGGGLESLKKATMGVFQITGKNSEEEYSYGGVFNTRSRNKTASITIKVDYSVN